MLVAVPLIAFASDQNAEELFLCRGDDDSTIAIETWKPSEFEPPVHCVQVSFLPDMTACAPNGGWGLGIDDNLTKLIEVTNDWSTAHKHETGKVAASVGTRGVRFVAFHGVGIGSNVNYQWKFVMARNSGKAKWHSQGDKEIAYDCELRSIWKQ